MISDRQTDIVNYRVALTRLKIKVLRSLRNKKRTSPAHGTHQFSCDFSDNSTFSRNESNNHANENHFDTKSGFKPSKKQQKQAMKKIKKFLSHESSPLGDCQENDKIF